MSSEQGAHPSSLPSRRFNSRHNTKFGSRASAQSDTDASTPTPRNSKGDGAKGPKQHSGDNKRTNRQQRRQHELDEGPSGDEYSAASSSVDTDQVPGSYAVDGPSRQNSQDRPQRRPTSDEEASTSALPVALPAELVPTESSNSNNPAPPTLVLATAAPDKNEDQDDETRRMFQNQKRMMWIGFVLIFVLALATALGFGLAFGSNRGEGGTPAGGGETPVAPPTTETPVATPSPSQSSTTISSSTAPTPSPSIKENPVSVPTSPPLAVTEGVCSCWYYTQEIFITVLEEREPLTGDRIGYWESVYRALTSLYDPNAFRRTRRELPEEVFPNQDGIVVATNVVLESQQTFGGAFSRFSGLSMAFQLEFCANPPPSNATSYLMDYHDAFLDWGAAAESSNILTERMQEEVGITSAYGTSVPARLDLECQ